MRYGRRQHEVGRGLLFAAALLAVACGGGLGAHANPTRGYILISIDTLRADHLGAYGYGRATSPFLDRLAAAGTLFERAIVQLPGTLPSHMSIFTGLYPAEHGVYPPDAVLSPEIITLPMRFHRAGYRTGGFTEGGYTAGRYGFARGFDEFSDASDRTPRAIEGTLAKAVTFLRSLAPSERFFLFIHTYTVHDPYDPVEPYRSMFWEDGVPEAFEPTGPNLTDANRGERELSDEGLRYFEALYDASIRYADARLQEFWQELEALGVQDEVTLVVTSDHGEEFREHGKLVHEQVYPETLHVPLMIVHPRVAGGRRVQRLVESVDIAATLYELAGIGEQPAMSGESLAGYLDGESEPAHSDAYAEAFATPTRTLLWSDGDLHQLLATELPVEDGGGWAMRSMTFDWWQSPLELQLSSFYRSRRITVSVDGQRQGIFEIGTETTPLRLDLPGGGKREVTLSSPGCDSPASVGINGDERCLSFRVGGAALRRTALFDLASDPGATVDVAGEQPDLYAQLLDELQARVFQTRAAPGTEALDESLTRRLRALGYLR